MDFIFLTGLTTDCIIGIWDWERRVKQKVVIDLEDEIIKGCLMTRDGKLMRS